MSIFGGLPPVACQLRVHFAFAQTREYNFIEFEECKMSDFDFAVYASSFNTTDEASFVERFYTEDMVLDGPFGKLEGRDKWLDILNQTHKGVREDLNFLTVVCQGDVIMAESEGTFTALIDLPEFQHGPLSKGESITVKFFSKYVIRDGKISEMKISWWDPNLRPPLG